MRVRLELRPQPSRVMAWTLPRAYSGWPPIAFISSSCVAKSSSFSLLRAAHFDLVVSDVEMPRLNGFDLTAKIRADKKLAELPVVPEWVPILAAGLPGAARPPTGYRLIADRYAGVFSMG